MKFKLLCADIDGTLLDDHKRLTEQTAECLRNAAEKGMKIVLSSGRMPAGVESIEKELGFECIKICNAGTYILSGERCIWSRHLPVEAMKNIYRRIAVKWKIPLWIFLDRSWYVTGVDKFVEREIKIISARPGIVDAEELMGKWEREAVRPNKLLLAADAQEIPAVYREMKEYGFQEIDIACSADIFIEIFPKGVDKGKALLAVCEKLGISPQETIAIGDQELDIPMIEAAGTGIAMGNAIAELKEKADFVTKTNNEDGVAWALKHFMEWF